MKNKLLAASMVASIGVLGSGIASAMEFDVYGSFRGGVYQKDTDSAYEGEGVDADNGNVADITALGKGTKTKSRDALETGVNNFGSRFGIQGSEDLGNGMSAGFRFERATESGDDQDGLGRRHENVWIQGGWGKLTLGQTDNTYRNAANWDQSYWFGGNARSSDGGSRVNSIRYDSNLGGPFSFSLQAIADDAEAETVADATTTTVTGAGEITTVSHPKVSDEEGIDAFAASASFDAGAATINLGYYTNNVDSQNPGGSYDVSAISANGALGGLSWYVTYESADDNTKLSAADDNPAACAGATADDCNAARAAARNYVNEVYTTPQDRDVIGVFLGYALGERDTIYLEYEDASVDGADVNLGSLDLDATLIGYSHKLGPSTTFIAEYVQVDNASDFTADVSKFWAGLKVDF